MAASLKTLLRRLLFAAGLVALYGATALTYRHSPAAAMLLPAAALVCGLGVFILRWNPNARLNVAFALFCVCVTAWLAAVYLYHMAAAGWGYGRVHWAIAALRPGPILAPPFLLLFTYEFLGRRGRVGKLLVTLAFVSLSPFVLLDAMTMEPRLAGHTYVAVSTTYTIRAILTILWILVWMSLMTREALRREPSARRSQCRTCLLGLVPAVGGGIIGFLPAFNRLWFPSFLGVLVVMFPVFVGLAVLRYQMFDIRIALRRTLPYVIVTGLIGAAYAGVVVIVDAGGEKWGPFPWGTDLVALAVFAGFGFQPTLEALQRALDRAFFRAEAELDGYLAGAGDRYRAAASVGPVAEMAAEDARDTMKLEWAAVLLAGDPVEMHSSGPVALALGEVALALPPVLPAGRRTIDLGSDEPTQIDKSVEPLREALAGTGGRLAVPLGTSGERGLLVCGEKLSRASFSARDRTFVVALAAQAEGAMAQVESRAEARQLRGLTSAILESLANSVALVDGEGRIVTCNPIFRRTFGGDKGWNIGDLGLSALVRPAALPREIRVGQRIFVASGRAIEGAEPAGMSVIVLTEVTDLRRLQDEANRREALARIGAAVASINHEIGNVLAPVGIYLDRARRLLRSEEAKDVLASVQTRLGELGRLGRELRDYYRDPVLSPTAVSLADVVESCLVDLQAVAGDGWSPPESEGLDLMLRADPQKLKQALLNVLKNAWEAMPKIDRKDWSVRARAEDGRAVIEVRDSGVGLAPDIAEHAFEPFFTRGKSRGVGLGLSIVERIADAHGAEVRLDGGEGRGAKVTLVWPLARDGESPGARRDADA